MNFFRREETVAKKIYDKLREDYDKLAEDYKNLRNNYHDMKNENQKMKDENEHLKNDLEDKKERLNSIEYMITNYKNREFHSVINNLQKIIAKSKNKQEEMQKALDESNEQINILTEENNQLKKQINDLENKIAEDDILGFSIINPHNLETYNSKKDIQNFVNSCHEQVQKLYNDYQELLQLFNNQKNENANLSQLNNELQASNYMLREGFKEQKVATIEIHDPLNNSTVDQKETIQEAINNIHDLYISTQDTCNLYIQTISRFQKH